MSDKLPPLVPGSNPQVRELNTRVSATAAAADPKAIVERTGVEDHIHLGGTEYIQSHDGSYIAKIDHAPEGPPDFRGAIYERKPDGSLTERTITHRYGTEGTEDRTTITRTDGTTSPPEINDTSW